MRNMLLVGFLLCFSLPPSFAFADLIAEPNDTPVLFLPGFQASRLYVFFEDGSFERVWEPLSNNDLRYLEMTSRGESVNDIRVGQVIDKIFGRETIYGENFFDTTNQVFVDTVSEPPFRLEDALLPEIRNYQSSFSMWTAYPYDWRYDVFDIIENGTVRMDGQRQYLIEVVEKLAEHTGSVHIVAHSNGGLLAKALMVKLTELGREDLVDKIILVGTPQLGTPEAVGGLLHGYRQNILRGFITNSYVAREMSRNFPGAYGLLPSKEYFEKISDPVVTSSVTQGIVTNIPPAPISTFEGLRNFLLGETFMRKEPEPRFVEEPIILNKNLLDKAQTTHERISSWSPDEDFHEIVGIGNETVSGFNYKNFAALRCPENRLICYVERTIRYEPRFTPFGDTTVISNSATQTAGRFLYLNLLRELNPRDRYEHRDLLTQEDVVQTVESILGGEEYSSPFITDKVSLPSGGIELISISAHSPVTLSAEDEEGNITSIEYDSDPDIELLKIREEIPGSFVEIIGEGKYLFLPDGEYEINITGTNTGSFDLILSEVAENGELYDLNSHQSIPITENGVAMVSITGKELSSLSLDIENDGIEDLSFDPGEPSETLLEYLKGEFDSLDLSPKLSWTIEQYFSLLEAEKSEDLRMTYISQLDRITRYLIDREITQATANKWRAYMRNLK